MFNHSDTYNNILSFFISNYGDKYKDAIEADINTITNSLENIYLNNDPDSFLIIIDNLIEKDYLEVKNDNSINYALKFIDFQHLFIAFEYIETQYPYTKVIIGLNELRKKLNRYCDIMAIKLKNFRLMQTPNLSNHNSDDLITILNKGIDAKRNGNYKLALDYYTQAQKINPLDSKSYNNSMKVLIGIEKYEEGFRNLLVLCHFNIIKNLFSKDIMAESFYHQFLPRFKWNSNELSKKYSYEPNLVFEGIKSNISLKDLIYRVDSLTYYMGHCYIGELKEIDEIYILNNDINKKYFYNLNYGFLGKESGQDFRGNPIEGYFFTIGFIYAHINLNFDLKSEGEIVNYYLNPKIEIKKDIWNYRQYLNI